MNIGLFEDEQYTQLLPLTWLRATFELRCGVDRLMDKVVTHTGGQIAALWTRPGLQAVTAERFRLAEPTDGAWAVVNGRAHFTANVSLPEPGVAWVVEDMLVAAGIAADDISRFDPAQVADPARRTSWLELFRIESPPPSVKLVRWPWELILNNEDELRRQCQVCGSFEGTIYPGVHLLEEANIRIMPGAKLKPGVVLDAENGPIIVDTGARIEPNAVLQGPCYIGPDSVVNPNAVIRAGTSIGSTCKVGGEIEGSIIHGFTNKQHDGFLGHSYIGEWVNLGADTITSDLKNTYGAIRVYINGAGVETGERFLGSIIGDHSKTGIGTILPTGCVVGAAANVFTQSTTPRFVPSFAWLTDKEMVAYEIEKALSIARIVMARRGVDLTPAEAALLRAVAHEARAVEAAGWNR
jgi:UDP-N-acetylglucosamine diphosphorylase/glucosamine-1-phosphate N-acetyltransferase